MLDSFIERIKEVNPVLNCVVADRFDEARKEAQATDQLIKSGTLSEETLAKEKPFLGVPFTTKDCIAVKGKTNLCHTKSNSMSYIHSSNMMSLSYGKCFIIVIYILDISTELWT